MGVGELEYAQGDGPREDERESEVQGGTGAENGKAPGLCRARRIVLPQSLLARHVLSIASAARAISNPVIGYPRRGLKPRIRVTQIPPKG